MSEEKNSKIFKKLWNDFETITREKYKTIFWKECKKADIGILLSDLAYKTKTAYSSERKFIEFCKEKRNNMTHENYENEYILYSDKFIEAFQSLLRKVKPEPIYLKSIHNVITKNVDDKISDALGEMSKNNYTHMPITKDWKLVWMLSEASLIKYMADNREVLLDLNETFQERMDLIDRKYSEDNVYFVSRNEDYDKVVNKFVEEYKNKQKISCILVTEKWKREEKILWILTAWDIIWLN